MGSLAGSGSRGGGWGVVEECEGDVAIRLHARVWKGYFGQWPGGDVVQWMLDDRNSLFFVGIGTKKSAL